MAFWSLDFWAADYWAEDYWPEASANQVHVQYPNVELLLSPTGTQSWATTWAQDGSAGFVCSFSAAQRYSSTQVSQTGNASFVTSFTADQTWTGLGHSQTGDAQFVTNFTAGQYLGLTQIADAQITFSFSAAQTWIGTLSHTQDSSVVFALIPASLQTYLLPFFGLEAVLTFNPVAGFPNITSTGVLSPARNIVDEEYFQFTVASKDVMWLLNAGTAGQPVFIEVMLDGIVVTSVNLYKDSFIIGPEHGALHSTVKAKLDNNTLSVTLRGYEKFASYVLAEQLEKDTTIRVRGYKERISG